MRGPALRPTSLRAALIVLLSFVLSALTLPLTAPSAFAADAELGIEAYVTGHQGEVPTVTPGESFSYTVNLQCSAAKCTDAAVTATLPAPLVYDADTAITVSPAIADGAINGRDLTVTFRDGGLDAGTVVMITVRVNLPTSASADYNGDAAKVTFTATAANADTVSDSASVALEIAPVLSADATKSAKPTTTQPAIGGRDVTFTIGGANTSNVSVDSVVIADPVDVTGPNAFDQLALTGISKLTAPSGSDRVAFSWYDGSTWHSGSAGAIPSDPSDLLSAVTGSGSSLPDVKGVRFTFSRDGGSLPAGEPAQIVLSTSSRDGAFDGLEEGDELDVLNTASATVVRAGDSAPDTAQATVTFKMQSVHIDVTKSFEDSALVAGKQTTVTLQASTGVMPTSSINVFEPAPGKPTLADQGLTFGSFVTDPAAYAQLTWPEGATSASITYTYADGNTEVRTTTAQHTLLPPTLVTAGNALVGFSVTFSAANDAIVSNATAVLPFTVTAQAVEDEAGAAITNTVEATATGETSSDTATASDDLMLLPQRVRTTIDKSFNRSAIWASAGSGATIQLTGKVTPDSTVGSDHLTITDDDGVFWDHFDLRRILPTDVPSNAILTVEYFDGTTWQQLTAPVTGPADGWTYTLTAGQRAAAQGIRFVFTPKGIGSLLPAGFTVVPRLDVNLRQTLRSDPMVSATVGADEITDTASSDVANSAAIISPVSDQDSATLTLNPVDGGGSGGVDLVEKHWLDPDTGAADNNPGVSALSDQQRTVAVRWGADGLSMSNVEVVDDPNVATISNSVYDAFNLVRIRPITTATDPLIDQDKVAKVELYRDGGWTDVTALACPSASACDGGFPGYTLTADQQQNTLAARLTFEAGSATDTGVVATGGDAHDRQVRLDFQLRRTLRSNPSAYVLGTSHDNTYNSGERGVANNNAQVTGTLSDGTGRIQSLDAAGITIYDRPLNVSFTKTLDQTALGIPQHDGDTLPLVSATLKATNNTASGVPEIDITDPSVSTSGLAWYRYLNLYQIELSGLPSGVSSDAVSVVLTRLDAGGATSMVTKSFAEAQAMTPSELVEVIGVRVVYGSEENLSDPSRPLIPTDATATVVLTYQLRANLRNDDGTAGSAMVETMDVTNTAQATVVSRSGIGCADAAPDETCNAPTATDSGQIDIADPTYTVNAGKTISPSARYEDESSSYTVTLTGQPTGTARTQLLTLTDATPTFWNAFDLASLPTVTLPAPVNQLRLWTLTGVDYTLVGGTLVAACSGSTDLSACWHASDWQDADANRQVAPALPPGISAADVRGVRFETRRVKDGTAVQWERPADPQVTIRFTVARRALLVHGTNGAVDTPVPSTLPGMATAPGEQAQGVTSDQVQVDGVAAWRTQIGNAYTGTDTADSSTILRHRVNQIKVEKTPGQGSDSEPPRYDLDATIPYRVAITNTGAWAMTGITIADQINLVGGSSPLVTASVVPAFSFTVDGTTVTGFSASLDTTTGAISITVPDGFVLAAGQKLVFTANLRFRDRLPAGTSVSNQVTVVSARDFERCEYTQNALAATPTTSVSGCSSATTVVAAASTPLTVSKAVKGTGAGDPAAAEGDANYDDLGVIAVGASSAANCQSADADGYYTAPCTPITRPGGKETWRLSLSNNGNVAANIVSAIDVLPTPGDTGVIVNTARKSRFTPTFLGNMHVAGLESAPAHTLTYYYTTTSPGTTCNKADILNDTKPGGQANCTISWIPFDNNTDAGDLATAKAIKVLVKFTDPADGLAPGVPFSVTFDTRTPAYAPAADATTVEPVAWNAVAVGSRTADALTFPARASLVTEPAKVGVAIASGELALSKTVAAPAADWTQWLPSSYTATVSCTSLGTAVPLRNSSGADVSTVQLAADGTVNAYNGTHLVNLPLFSTCELAETPGQGASATFQPASAIAVRDYSAVANIAHGWPSGSATAALGVTNTYSAAGFTVTKTVPDWPAKYADGSPVVFKDFAYSASCTFLGHEVVPEADRTFALRDGGSKAFANLPAGASCTVTETYAAGAADTTVTTTQAGDEVDAGSTTTDFSLVAGDASATAVTYTNTFAAGSAVITKDFSGAGSDAWGDQDFEVQLVCTHPDADPGEVHRSTKTLSKASGLSWTVEHLAAGAQCVVTETATGGATGTTITGGTFTVDADQPAQTTVTNRFATGTVTVTKQVQANGAATTASPWADGSFPVTLSCTRPVDGTDLPVTIPGGATRNLTRAGGWAVTWSGLPTNATCSVAEDAAAITGVTGQPDPTVTVTPAAVTVPDSGTTTFSVVNNYRAGKLNISKTLLGAGTSFFAGATFSVSCTLDGNAVFTRSNIPVPAGTLTSGDIGPLPFGSSCTVTETSTGGADATPAPQVVTVSQNDATSDVTTLSFTNTFSAGTLTITKALAGEAAGEAWATGGTFVVAVSCGTTSTASFTQNVTIVGAGSATLMNGGNPRLFPVGTHCWASETTKGGATSSTVSATDFASGVVVTAQADPTVAQALGITATNTYLYAGLTVTKTVAGTTLAKDQNGNSLTYPGSVSFRATCTFNNSTATSAVLDSSFSVTGSGDGLWGSTTFDKLPSGASCTVTETTPGMSPTVTYVVTRTGQTAASGTGTSTSFALVTGGPSDNVAAFTNTFTVGNLVVRKVVSPTSSVWASAPFTVTVLCTVGYPTPGTTAYSQTYTFSTSAASYTVASIGNLPSGASCTTTETKTGGATTTTYANRTGSITSGGTLTTTVTNTFSIGSVRITKALRANGAATTAEPWASAGYTMTLSCTRVVNGASETVDPTKFVTSATQVLNKANSYTYTWTGLPRGAVCTATETAITYPPGTPVQPAPTVTHVPTQAAGVTVGASTVTQTVTNDFAFGNVQIVKTLAGDAADAWGTGTFTYSVSCTLDGTTGTVFARAGITLSKAAGLTSSAIGPIPKGSICTVTETGTAGATSISPASGSVVLDAIEAGGTRTAAFTNTFDYAGFTVTKTVTNGGAQDQDGADITYAAAYHFSATCTLDSRTVLSVADFTLVDGGSQSFGNLPVGASCSVTETNTGNAHASSVITQNGTAGSTTDGATSSTFALVAGQSPLASTSPAATVVAFTDTYAIGGLDIAKTVDGSGATAWGGGPFTVRVVCTLDHDANTSTAEVTVFSATNSMVGDDTWAIRKLPTGAHCAVTETKTGGANTTTIDLPSPTITTAVQAVTVTNTFNTGSVQVTKAIAAGLGTLAPWKDATYEFTLACGKDFDGDGTAETITVANAVKTVTGPGTVTWSGLPQGASCAATETSITYPAGTPTQPDPTVSSTGAVTIGNATTVGQTLTNSFSTAKVNIAKTIAGTAATTWGTGPFVFSVTCALTGSGTVFGPTTVTLTPTAGQTSLTSADLGPIPQGSTCVVTETDAAGAVPTDPSNGKVTLAAVEAGRTTTASLTNTFDFAGFTVSKAVDSDALDADGAPIAYDPASFTASCLFRGVETLTNAADRSFTLTAGGTRAFSGLPTGANCIVRETGTSGAASTEVTVTQGLSSETATATTAAFTLVPGGSTATTADFTNRYTVGSLEITKAVTGSGADLWGGGDFELSLTCTLGEANPNQVYSDVKTVSKADPDWTVGNLPTGATCQVSEPRTGGANSTVISDAGSATIGVGTVARTTVTNTFTLGAVTVSKKLTVDGAPTTAAAWTQGTYTVALSCTRDFDGDGAAEAITIPNGTTRTITGAGSVTYTDLPTDATCSVAETGSSPVAQATTISPTGTVTVGSGPATPQSFTITNDFQTSTMSVLKQLEGAGQASFGDGPFTFGVACTLAGATEPVYTHTVTLTRATGSTATSLREDGLGPIPIGAECTVTETDRGAADATPAPVTLTIAADAAGNVATFTNQFSAGTVWLTKTLAGAAKDETWATGATFGVLVTCQVEVDGVRGTVLSREVNIGAGEHLNVLGTDGNPSRVPLGSHCWISEETDRQGATSTALDQHDWDSAAVVTAGSPASLQPLELGLTNTYEYAGFSLSKAVDNGGAVDAGGSPITYPAGFGFHTICSFNGSTVQDRTDTVIDGGSLTFMGLPAGADCTATETGTGNAASTSVQLTQDGTAQAVLEIGSVSFTLVRGSGADPADAGVTTAAFTNRFTTGAITVAKELAGDGAADWGDQVFTMMLRCTLDTDASPDTPDALVFEADRDFSAVAGMAWTVDDLATGASCEVSETATGGANSTTISDPTPTVGNDSATPVEVTVTNEFTLGSVEVSKQIQVDGSDSDAEPYASASYQVKLTCQMLVNGKQVPVDIPGDDHPAGDHLDGVRTLTGTSSTLFTGLPTGAACQVSELSAGFPLPSDQVSIDHPSLTVATGATVDSQVTNNYHTGTLQLTKVLQGDGVPDWSDGDFIFAVSCQLTDTDGVQHEVFSRATVVLNQADGLSSDVFSGIPVGADCAVTETRSGGADVPAATVSVNIVDGQQNVATPTNQFNVGSLLTTLGLTLDGTPTTTAEPFIGGRYTVEVACTREVNGSEQSVAIPGGNTWTFTGPGSHVFTGLPVGAECSIRQTSSSLTPQDVTYDPAGPDGPASGSGTVAITADTGSPSTLGVVDHFRTSTLTVTKQILGSSENAAFPFRFDVSCTLAEDGVDTPHAVFDTTTGLSVADGLASDPLGPIPVGSHCRVTETASGGATIGADPAEITIEQVETNHVTMVNTFGVGTVVVTKAITVDGETSTAEPYASATYTVTLTCTAPVDGQPAEITVPGGASRTITGAGTAEFTGLPLGATCSAAETDSSLAIPADQVSISPDNVTVGEEPVGITITNDFRTGSLVLNWRVTGVGTRFAGPASFSVECTLGGATGWAFRQEVTLPPSEAQGTFASATFTPIPVGAHCDVTQTDAQGADQLSSVVIATGTVDLEADVVNEYSAGSLTITKRLQGADASAHRNTRFRFTVTCLPVDGTTSYTGVVSIVGAGSTTISDDSGQPRLFPAGTSCWAEESGTGGADQHWVDHDSANNALAVVTGQPDAVQELVVRAVNTFTDHSVVGSENDDLAYTGFAGSGLAVLGLACLAFGAWLVRRRRA